MNKRTIVLILILGCIIISITTIVPKIMCSHAETHSALIPYPKSIEYGDSTFTFSSIRFQADNFKTTEVLDTLWTEFKQELLTFGHKEECDLHFFMDSCLVEESYTLNVQNHKILISASGFPGFFNGIQTLRQLIVKKDKSYEIPKCEIYDDPAFKIRGVMLDVGRNYIPISQIKDIVKSLSKYKINLLHLHLTDNPGWRIESFSHPQITDSIYFWNTRQPGKYYKQKELKDLVAYCEKLNMKILPEVDMPGHSDAFKRAFGYDMQTKQGIEILKDLLDEIIPIFPYEYFHIGSDEIKFKMKEFMPEMIKYVRDKGKEVIVWSPGYLPDTNAVKMCWGENEIGYKLDKSSYYIDCNGFYLDWMDSQTGVPQIFFQQPCETIKGNQHALGSIMCVWTDGALKSGQRIIEQYPFYPCALTFAERIWRGNDEKRIDLMAQLPEKGTEEWNNFNEFENRLIYHRDHYFKGIAFPYVKQSEIKWKVIGPFDHKGINDTSFEPEKIIKEEYSTPDTVLKWQDQYAYGGAIQIRSLYVMFNSHKKVYRRNAWPTLMSSEVDINPGTCYALTYFKSPKEQNVYLMFGLNGMWGHSGGYRSARAPEQGSWDFEGGDVWLNDERVEPPAWPFESLPWGGWGKGRIEIPLTEEGYFYRPPVPIHLKKGINKILVRTVSGAWKGDRGDCKWQFCCMPVLWDGIQYKEVPDLECVFEE